MGGKKIDDCHRHSYFSFLTFYSFHFHFLSNQTTSTFFFGFRQRYPEHSTMGSSNSTEALQIDIEATQADLDLGGLTPTDAGNQHEVVLKPNGGIYFRTYGFACTVHQRSEMHRCNGISVCAKAGDCRISKVMSGSAAARAGLYAGDIIKTTNGNKLPNGSDLLDIIHSMSTVPHLALGVKRRLRAGSGGSSVRRISAAGAGRVEGANGNGRSERSGTNRYRRRGGRRSPQLQFESHRMPSQPLAALHGDADWYAIEDAGEGGSSAGASLPLADNRQPAPCKPAGYDHALPLRDYTEITECKICFAAAKDTVLVPCGHQTCGQCAQRLRWPYSWQTVPTQCPFCRVNIERSVKVFE